MIYARAAAATVPAIAADAPSEFAAVVSTEREDRVLNAVVVPAVIVFMMLLVRTPMHAFVRTFLSMWVHELGHAMTAWFFGFTAIPGPWKTFVPEHRNVVFGVLLSAALAAWCWQLAHRAHFKRLGAVAVILLAQLVCTWGADDFTAQVWITFGGDGGGLVLGALLISSFYWRGYVRDSGLRWGFLVIGAAAFVDISHVWSLASQDFAEIPFGENEGVGLSDASRLVEQYRWPIARMLNRYVWLSRLCGLALLTLYFENLRGVPKRSSIRASGRGPTSKPS